MDAQSAIDATEAIESLSAEHGEPRLIVIDMRWDAGSSAHLQLQILVTFCALPTASSAYVLAARIGREWSVRGVSDFSHHNSVGGDLADVAGADALKRACCAHMMNQQGTGPLRSRRHCLSLVSR